MKHLLLLLIAALPLTASAQSLIISDVNSDGIVDQRDVNVMKELVLGYSNSWTQINVYQIAALESNVENNSLISQETGWSRTFGTGVKQTKKYTFFNADGTIDTSRTKDTVLPTGAFYYNFEPIHSRIRFYNEAREPIGMLNVLYIDEHFMLLSVPASTTIYRLDR